MRPASAYRMVEMTNSELVLITGARQVGKSTACLQAVELMRDLGLEVAGLLTRRTGPHDLTVLELHTGEAYPLTLPFDAEGNRSSMNFRMNTHAFSHSLQALTNCFPTEVVIVDELGPLEFKRREGWVQALELLQSEPYTIGFVVVRPELLGQAVEELHRPRYTVIRVDQDGRDRIPEMLAATAQAAVIRSQGTKEA